MNVLIADDEPNVLKTLTIGLQSIGLTVVSCHSPVDALEIVQHSSVFELAFLDLKMYPMDGIELMERIRMISPTTTISIITAHGTVDSAVQAIKHGAYDYILKPIELDDLRRFVDRAMAFHRLKLQVVPPYPNFRDSTESRLAIVTRSPDMIALIAMAERVADTPLPILIEGESGTGKELFADLIHNASSRKSSPFVRVNCAALPENLLESELFGHVKGSFTGAHKDRIGRFELADGGTILLDEVGELPMQLQAKLLRVLQSREFERLGESRTIKIDVRILVATNRDLEHEINEGRFREDLYYRINVVKMRIPPLRERVEDIALLALHFIDKYCATRGRHLRLSPEALALLEAHEWKGNVREMENAIARAVFLATGDELGAIDLPESIRGARTRNAAQSLEHIEREHIIRVISESQSLEEAARILQIDVATLWRKRKKYNL